jgi:hypothetical protein
MPTLDSCILEVPNWASQEGQGFGWNLTCGSHVEAEGGGARNTDEIEELFYFCLRKRNEQHLIAKVTSKMWTL